MPNYQCLMMHQASQSISCGSHPVVAAAELPVAKHGSKRALTARAAAKTSNLDDSDTNGLEKMYKYGERVIALSKVLAEMLRSSEAAQIHPILIQKIRDVEVDSRILEDCIQKSTQHIQDTACESANRIESLQLSAEDPQKRKKEGKRLLRRLRLLQEDLENIVLESLKEVEGKAEDLQMDINSLRKQIGDLQTDTT